MSAQKSIDRSARLYREPKKLRLSSEDVYFAWELSVMTCFVVDCARSCFKVRDSYFSGWRSRGRVLYWRHHHSLTDARVESTLQESDTSFNKNSNGTSRCVQLSLNNYRDIWKQGFQQRTARDWAQTRCEPSSYTSLCRPNMALYKYVP